MTEPRFPIDNAFAGPRFGGAEEATFSGALSFMRRRYTKDLSGVDIAVWGVPSDMTPNGWPSGANDFEATSR